MLSTDFLALGGFGSFVVAVLVVVMAIIWVYQFVQLMLLEDEVFAGRYDKILWVIVFILIWPLAPFAFVIWKGAKTGGPDRTS